MAEYGLGTASGKLLLDTSDYEEGFRRADRAAGNFADKSKQRSADIQKVGRGLFAIGVAGAAGFGLAVKSAADFEERLSAVKAVSGASVVQMESLRKKALQLGRDTAYGATDAALAMEELVKAGLSVDDVLNGAADATVALAAAGEVDLAEAAVIASSAMNQFSLSAEELPKVADLIAGAANSSAIDVSDFGMSITQAGAVANLAGLTFNDAALAITAMGNAGIRGSDAGTSLKTFLQNLQPTTEKQIDLFHELGLAIEDNATAGNELGNVFYDSEGSIRSMVEISASLNEALAGMSDAQKTMALETIFGTDAIRAAGTFANLTEAEMVQLQDTLESTSASDVAAERLNNLNGKLTILKGSLSTLLIEVGTPFLEYLTQAAEKATELTNALLSMDAQQRQIIVTVALAVSAVAGLLGSFIVFAKVFAPVISGFRLLALVASPLIAVLGAIGLPILLAIAAIVALAAGFYLAYTNMQEFRDFVDTVIDKIVEFALTVYSYFMETILPALQSFADFFLTTIVPAVQNFVEIFLAVVGSIITWFTDVFLPALISFATTVQELLLSIWTWVEANVIPTVEAVVELILAIVNRIVEVFNNQIVPAVQAAWTIISTIIEVALAIIQPLIDNALKFIVGLFQFFINFVQNAWSLFGDNILQSITNAFNAIKLIVETVLGVIRGIAQTLTGLISGDWDQFLTGLRTLWDTLWNALSGAFELAWDTVKLAIETAIDALQLAFETVLDAIGLAWDTLWGSLEAVIQGAWDAIKVIVDAIIDAMGRVADAIGSALDKAKDFANGGLNPFGDVPLIPLLADGAILTKATLAVVAESGPEAVIPMTDPSRALELLNASGLSALVLSQANGGSGGSSGNTQSAPSASPSAAGPAVMISEANFYENADIDAMLQGAEMVSSARSFS